MALEFLLLPLRIFQALFAIIVLGISARLVHLVHHLNGGFNVSQFDYLLFTAIWTLLIIGYLLFISYRLYDAHTGHRAAVTALDALSWIFWLAAFACFAHIVRKYPCTRYIGCGLIKAALAFSILEWLLFTVTLLLAGLALSRGGSGMNKTPATSGAGYGGA